jgi:hypothetical protein
MIYDWATMVFVHCFLFEDVTVGEAGLLVLSWWWLYYSGTLLFCNSSSVYFDCVHM